MESSLGRVVLKMVLGYFLGKTFRPHWPLEDFLDPSPPSIFWALDIRPDFIHFEGV